jgi:hypothetical protein
MQTFYGTFIVGAGMALGSVVGGAVGETFTTDPGEPTVRERLGIETNAGVLAVDRQAEAGASKIRDWPAIWLTSAAISTLALAAFAVAFPRLPREQVNDVPRMDST